MALSKQASVVVDRQRAVENLQAFRPQQTKDDYPELIRRAGDFTLALVNTKGLDLLQERFESSVTALRGAMPLVASVGAYVTEVEKSAGANWKSISPPAVVGAFGEMIVPLFQFFLWGEQLLAQLDDSIDDVVEANEREPLERLREEALKHTRREQQGHWAGCLFLTCVTQTAWADAVNYDVYKALLACPCDVVRMTQKVQDAAANLWKVLWYGVPEPGAEVWPFEGYTKVLWYGTWYRFSTTQAAYIKYMWEAHDRGEHEPHENTIINGAKGASDTLRDAFRIGKRNKLGKVQKVYHPAYGKGKMIEPLKQPRGCYRLNFQSGK